MVAGGVRVIAALPSRWRRSARRREATDGARVEGDDDDPPFAGRRPCRDARRPTCNTSNAPSRPGGSSCSGARRTGDDAHWAVRAQSQTAGACRLTARRAGPRGLSERGTQVPRSTPRWPQVPACAPLHGRQPEPRAAGPTNTGGPSSAPPRSARSPGARAARSSRLAGLDLDQRRAHRAELAAARLVHGLQRAAHASRTLRLEVSSQRAAPVSTSSTTRAAAPSARARARRPPRCRPCRGAPTAGRAAGDSPRQRNRRPARSPPAGEACDRAGAAPARGWSARGGRERVERVDELQRVPAAAPGGQVALHAIGEGDGADAFVGAPPRPAGRAPRPRAPRRAWPRPWAPRSSTR